MPSLKSGSMMQVLSLFPAVGSAADWMLVVLPSCCFSCRQDEREQPHDTSPRKQPVEAHCHSISLGDPQNFLPLYKLHLFSWLF